MSYRKKISVVVLGRGDSLKKALISTFLGKDISQIPKRMKYTKTEIYENDAYEFTCTPDLYTERQDIRDLFLSNTPDMSLLVIEEGFSTQDVWMQIEALKDITGRPAEEFRVVLPLSYNHTDSYPFNFYSMEGLFRELSKLAEDRRQMSTNKRYADPPESYMSTSHSAVEMTGGRHRKKPFTGTKNIFKRLYAGTNVNLVPKGLHAGTKVNLVLLGLRGTGKSASGNTILGKEVFISRVSSNPVTTECQDADTEIGGTRVHVIDTPDIFDDDIKSSVKDEHVAKCRQLCQPGPCVYLLVMQVGRFTDCERDVLKKLEEAFGRRAQEQTVILFTRGDDLQRADVSLEDFLYSCQPDLKKIVERCDKRCVLFENSASGEHQVKELMQTVGRMLNKTEETMTVLVSDHISQAKRCSLFSCIII